MASRSHAMTSPCSVKMRGARERTVPVIFSYNLDRPFEVELQVESGSRGIFAKFPVARELLALGCGAAVGDLHHRVYPDGGTVVITMADARGLLVFRASKLALDMFLGQTYKLRSVQADDPSLDVEPDLEAEMDRWLAHFLKEA